MCLLENEEKQPLSKIYKRLYVSLMASVLANILPDDVVYTISTFDALHREKMAPTLRAIFLREVAVNGILRRLNYIWYSPTLLRARGNVEDPGYFVKMLSKCNCCSRHKTNRPKKLSDSPEYPYSGINNLDCACMCRHASRMIIREFAEHDDDYYSDDEYSDYEDELIY